MKVHRTVKLPKKPRRPIAIDFDGVLHLYSRGFHDGTIYDKPIPGARAALIRLRKKYWIYIFSARAHSQREKDVIAKWLRKNKIPFDEVVNHKPVAFAYIDDRAIHFDNWKQALGQLKEMEVKHALK